MSTKTAARRRTMCTKLTRVTAVATASNGGGSSIEHSLSDDNSLLVQHEGLVALSRGSILLTDFGFSMAFSI